MADRIIQDLSDIRLRSGDSPEATMEFLQLNSYDVCKWDDDFLDTSNADMDRRYTRAVTGSGSGAVLTLTTGEEWGSARMTTGTTNDGISAMSLGVVFKGDYNAVVAVRLKINVIAAAKIEVGFRDTVANNTVGIVNALDDPTFSATNGCCWVYDTDATTDTWAVEGVKASSVATGETLATTASGSAPVADTYQTLVVALMEDNAYFMRYNADGRKQGETILVTGAQTGSVALAPCVFVQTRNTTTKLLDIDFIKAWQLRRS